MRKVIVLSLALLLVISAIGLLTIAGEDTVKHYDVENAEDLSTLLSDYGIVVDADKLEDYEEVIVVLPPAFEEREDTSWSSHGNGKVLVFVDPIHVTE